MTKELLVKIVNGQWYATQDGKHLTAQETAHLIAKGMPYRFEKAEQCACGGTHEVYA